jgi:hypothetical protein
MQADGYATPSPAVRSSGPVFCAPLGNHTDGNVCDLDVCDGRLRISGCFSVGDDYERLGAVGRTGSCVPWSSCAIRGPRRDVLRTRNKAGDLFP